MSSHEDEPAANDNTPISPPNVEVVSDTKYVFICLDIYIFILLAWSQCSLDEFCRKY